MGVLLDSVGHRVKIHKITSATGKERGYIEIRDYVVTSLVNPQRRLRSHESYYVVTSLVNPQRIRVMGGQFSTLLVILLTQDVHMSSDGDP